MPCSKTSGTAGQHRQIWHALSSTDSIFTTALVRPALQSLDHDDRAPHQQLTDALGFKFLKSCRCGNVEHVWQGHSVPKCSCYTSGGSWLIYLLAGLGRSRLHIKPLGDDTASPNIRLRDEGECRTIPVVVATVVDNYFTKLTMPTPSPRSTWAIMMMMISQSMLAKGNHPEAWAG